MTIKEIKSKNLIDRFRNIIHYPIPVVFSLMTLFNTQLFFELSINYFDTVNVSFIECTYGFMGGFYLA
jgi:hypothetical protein